MAAAVGACKREQAIWDIFFISTGSIEAKELLSSKGDEFACYKINGRVAWCTCKNPGFGVSTQDLKDGFHDGDGFACSWPTTKNEMKTTRKPI